MRNTRWIAILLAVVLTSAGCKTEVSTTNDSVRVEAEVPKIEVKKTPDLDPRTDDDVDVKTRDSSKP